MTDRAAILLLLAACSSKSESITPSDAAFAIDVSAPNDTRVAIDAPGGVSTDAPAGGSDAAPPACTPSTGAFPRAIVFAAAGDDGVFDPSLAADVSSGRIWLSYSGTHEMADGVVLVSTRLGYSDDNGASWCDTGLVINPAAGEPDPPVSLAGHPAYWNHEVSRIFYDPAAPLNERWKIVWHRYLLSDSGAADDRQFQFGWIGLRAAGTPTDLPGAAEQKLFAASLYAVDSPTQTYNDAVIGAPAVRVDHLDPATADCLVVSEPGVLATASATYVSLLCGDGNTADNRIIILEEQNGTWKYNGAVLTQTDAKALNASFDGFSGSDLVTGFGQTHIIASPTASNAYFGCLGYQIDLDTATLVRAPGNPSAPEFYDFGNPSLFTGACGFDEHATQSGLLYGEAHVGEPEPVFRLFSSGVDPYLMAGP